MDAIGHVVDAYRGPLAIAFTALALVFAFVLFPAAARRSGSKDNKVQALQLAFTRPRFEAVLRAWSAHRDDAVRIIKRDAIVTLDFAFPLIYALAMALSFLALSGSRPRSGLDWFFVVVPFVAAGWDLLENVIHLGLLAGVDTKADVDAAIASGRFSPAWIATASIAATIKFGCFFLGLGGVAFALCRRLFSNA